jgi:putative flippase GtrA
LLGLLPVGVYVDVIGASFRRSADRRKASESGLADNGLIRDLLRLPRVARFLRYAVGSAIASAVSAVVLAVTAWTSIVAPAVASVVAFVAGAIVNFAVYRFWAWRHTVTRAVAAIGRDFAGYAVIAVSTAALATGATYLAGRYADHAALGSAARTLLLEGSYFGVFALMFAAKFVILDRYVFVHRRAEPARDAGTHAPEPTELIRDGRDRAA